MSNYPQQPPANPYDSQIPYQQQQPVSPVIKVSEWLLTMLILMIPVVNIIMIFVWAFGEGNATKQNYFKACLIWAAIWSVASIVFFFLFVGVFAAILDGISNYSNY